ncbi:hypothetical protein INR49_026356 [Caranx melampygus]|nr:hypothetical protein INR49_026356 [Caranx melampygus]
MSKSPCSPTSKVKASKHHRSSRRIFAEDPDWSLDVVPSLSDQCLRTILKNFQERPIFQELNFTQRDFIQERLSLSLPLHMTANIISDGVYWKRCCEQRWDLCDVWHYGHSWKRMFFERHMENAIELFIPNVTDPKTILQMVPFCTAYIKRLEISQLLPPITEPHKEEEEYGLELASDSAILLDQLTNLEELHLVYRVKKCGMNFEWKMFEMTDRDCETLAKALKSCKTLKILRLSESHIEDDKCRHLVKYLLDHPSLRELDLSHNMIGDRGARAIGKLLTKSKLEILNVCDNNIRGPGAKAIAHALSKSSTLLSLNLRLNRLRDEGGQAIGKALLSNNTLRHLHLGANELTGPTARALAQALYENNTLESLSLSCNSLGEDGGKALEEAMSHKPPQLRLEPYRRPSEKRLALKGMRGLPVLQMLRALREKMEELLMARWQRSQFCL